MKLVKWNRLILGAIFTIPGIALIVAAPTVSFSGGSADSGVGSSFISLIVFIIGIILLCVGIFFIGSGIIPHLLGSGRRDTKPPSVTDDSTHETDDVSRG